MKKIIALLMLAAIVLTAAACGAKTPVETTTETTAEVTTDPAVTQPDVGRISEKTSFYVYVPEHWCKMEYLSNGSRLRLFDIPSAPKIEEGKTHEVEILVAEEAGTKADVDAAVAKLLENEGAKKGKDAKLGGETFTVVTYTDAKEERAYTAYVGLAGGTLATVTLKGLQPDNEDVAAILRSISFKPMNKRVPVTTTTKPATTTAKTTKASGETTKAAAKTTTAAAKTTTAAAKTTTAAAKTTTAADKTTTAAAKTTTAAAKTTSAVG